MPNTLRRYYPSTPIREYRTRKGLTLMCVAAHSQEFSSYRISVLERCPELARPGELKRLREAVDLAAEEEQRRPRRPGAGGAG